VKKMLKMLKFDFYKIIKSKMLLVFLIVASCFAFINPIITYIINGYKLGSTFNHIFSGSGILYLISWIFIIPFAAKDFSSKYIKNIYPNFKKSDKFYYVLSKVFYIFIFCLIQTVLAFALEIIFNYIFGEKCIYNPIADDFTKEEVYLKVLCEMLNSVAMGTVYLFLCMLFKNEYIPIIIVLPYIFVLSHLLYGAINSIIDKEFFIEKYTIFGVSSILTAGLDSIKSYVYIIMISLGYSVLFTLLSWLMFRKRSY